MFVVIECLFYTMIKTKTGDPKAEEYEDAVPPPPEGCMYIFGNNWKDCTNHGHLWKGYMKRRTRKPCKTEYRGRESGRKRGRMTSECFFHKYHSHLISVVCICDLMGQYQSHVAMFYMEL